MSTAGSRQMQGGSHTFPPPPHTHTPCLEGLLRAEQPRARVTEGFVGSKNPRCAQPSGTAPVGKGLWWGLHGLCVVSAPTALLLVLGEIPSPTSPHPYPHVPSPHTPHSHHPLSSWFHGKISGVEAVQELQPPEDGLFLVRESVRHPGDYVLCVSFGKEVIHYRVLHRENTLSIDSEQYFCNLIDMIEVREPIVKDFGVTLVWHTVMENLWGDPDPIHVTSWPPHPVASGGFTAAVGGFCYSSPFSTP